MLKRYLYPSLLILVLLLLAACSVTRTHSEQPLQANAPWVLLPIVNNAQTPQAGQRAEAIVSSMLLERGISASAYPVATTNEAMLILDDRQRYEEALAWARDQSFRYAVTGSIEEWQYKSGIDAEPAVGMTLKVISLPDGEVLWSATGARSGWGRDSTAATAHKLLHDLVDEAPLQ